MGINIKIKDNTNKKINSDLPVIIVVVVIGVLFGFFTPAESMIIKTKFHFIKPLAAMLNMAIPILLANMIAVGVCFLIKTKTKESNLPTEFFARKTLLAKIEFYLNAKKPPKTSARYLLVLGLFLCLTWYLAPATGLGTLIRLSIEG